MWSSTYPPSAGHKEDALDLRERLEWREAELGVFDFLPVGIIYVDRRCKVSRINHTAAQWIGAGPREAHRGRHVRELLPDVANAVERQVARVFATGQAIFDHDVTRAKEPMSRARVGYLPVLLGEGDVRRVAMVVEDVTDLRGAPISTTRERDYRRPSTEESSADRVQASTEPRSALEMVCASKELRAVLEAVDVVAASSATVLIQGESGVGKELVARAIHEKSARAAAPLVTVNCAAIPRELFESEFFGHVRGAFTGAHRDRIGRFELAHGGSIFLDEVAEIPLGLQAKLLRVVQHREFELVGDHRTRRVDARIIAATNRDLEAEVRAGRFRRDLYYRLSVFPIKVPPLRERPADTLALTHHFVRLYSAQLGRDGLVLTDQQAQALLAHDWPGNVRELENVIERAVIKSPRPPLRLELSSDATVNGEVAPSTDCPHHAQPLLTAAQLRERERENIIAALNESRWRVSGKGGAAELLGMRPSTLRDRLQALAIRRR